MSTLKKHWHWILFVLIIFGGIGVVLFTQLNTDTKPETVYNPPSEETLQNIRDKLAAQKAQETDTTKRPPPPGETHETGHWHGDHWHRTAPSLQAKGKQGGTPKRMGYFERIYKKYGVEPPPPGYWYRMSDPGVLKLDENGNPILYKEGEAVFDIHKIPGFAPTYEQYQHYKELIQRRDHARRTGNDARADQLNVEIRQLKEDAQGLIPFVTASQLVPSHLVEEAKTERDRRSSEIIRQAYIDMGLGYMVE